MNISSLTFRPLPLLLCAVTALASSMSAQRDPGARLPEVHRTREVRLHGDASPVALRAGIAGGVAIVEATGGEPFGRALVLLGSGLRAVTLAPIGMVGSLMVEEVFSVVPITFDAKGNAGWSFDLLGSDFARHTMSVHMQILVVDVGPAGRLSGSVSNHLTFEFTGGVLVADPWVGPTGDPSMVRAPRPTSIVRLPIDDSALPSR